MGLTKGQIKLEIFRAFLKHLRANRRDVYHRMSIQELKAEVARLPAADMKAFARWFEEFRADAWDRKSKKTYWRETR